MSCMIRKDAGEAVERATVGLTEIKLAPAGGDIGSFAGYASVFGNVDAHGDVMQRGAYARTLKEWAAKGKLPKMLLQHGGWGVGATDLVPIGQWTSMEENDRGLKVAGRLFALDSDLGRLLYENLKAGELDALSVGFIPRIVKEGTKPGEPRRTFLDVDLKEVSIVLFGANDRARISAVKSLTTDELRDLEGRLRDGGLSRRDAVTASSVFKDWLRRDAGAPEPTPRDEDVSDEVAETAAAMQRLAARFAVGALKF